MSEKKYIDDDEGYEEYVNSSEYSKLTTASINAMKAKDQYMSAKAEKYADVLKEAKIKDLNVPKEYMEIAKKLISDIGTEVYYDDGNLEYNNDSFYDDWVEKEKFK